MTTIKPVDGGTLDAALRAELAALEPLGLAETLRAASRRRGAQVLVGSRLAVDFSSHDYLGLASELRLVTAMLEALRTEGTGAAGGRLASGSHPLHEQLERELARFKRTESALLFPGGYLASVGAIPALVGSRDVIYVDALAHPALHDGCRLSQARVRTFPQGDLDALAAMLRADAGTFRRRLIVVESVSALDGDMFPLDRLPPLARDHDAWTYVEDSHATGVLGDHGRGAVEQWGLAGEIDVVAGTLGAALGTAGGYVAGSRTLVDYLTQRARTIAFTTAMPPALAAAGHAALRILEDEPWRRGRLRANIVHVRRGLRALGREGGDDAVPIVPIVLGDPETTQRVSAALLERGFLVDMVRPPMAAPGASRLRITVSAAHTPAQIASFLDGLAAVLPAAIL